MEKEEKQPDVLYDFLYRDTNRLTSYYSQIFQGKLASIEESENTKEAAQKTGSASIPQIASGQFQKTNEIQDSIKRIFDPHDLNITDVLSFLTSNEFIYDDYIHAPNGSLVIARGTLTFVDRYMMGTLVSAFDIAVQNQIDIGLEQNPESLLGIKVIQEMIISGYFPTFYFLQTDDNYNIFGSIKDLGMEEPVTSYYFRHGEKGLGDVYLIGLKEVSTVMKDNLLPVSLREMSAFRSVMNQLFQPENGIKVTPLAFFRKFEHRKEPKVVLGSASRRPRY